MYKAFILWVLRDLRGYMDSLFQHEENEVRKV